MTGWSIPGYENLNRAVFRICQPVMKKSKGHAMSLAGLQP
jgi:hypothetical protein